MPFNKDFHCFSGNPLDRTQAERRDPAWLETELKAPASRFVPFLGDVPLIAIESATLEAGGAGEIGWLALDDVRVEHIDRDRFHLLGKTSEGASRFACNILEKDDDADVIGNQFVSDGKFIDVRSVAMGGIVPPLSASILAQAKSLTGWHKSHRYCSVCGQPSKPTDAGLSRRCASCKASHFPRTDPVVIMLIVRGDECLLGRSPHYPEGQYSTLAGFIDQGETIEEAVRREIKEETNIDVGAVSYHSSQPWPFPSSLMIGCHGEALSYEIDIDEYEIEGARWFSRDETRMMLERTHPDNIFVPVNFAIAHHLIKHFVEG